MAVTARRELRARAGEPPADFTAGTWNVYHDSPRRKLEPTLERIHGLGVSLLLVQEADKPEVRDMLRDAGYRVAFHPQQYVVAWDPRVWVEQEHYPVQLARTDYFANGSTRPRRTEAVAAELTHRDTRHTLLALSYHTPAYVQQPGAPLRRRQALREAAATWGRLARQTEADACLFGGDDNVDERMAHGPWGFLLKPATGLRQVTADEGTHGRGGRRIDDFRTKGLRPIGTPVVLDTVSDHHAHLRAFRFRR